MTYEYKCGELKIQNSEGDFEKVFKNIEVKVDPPENMEGFSDIYIQDVEIFIKGSIVEVKVSF